jgi:hypothetical protein
MKNYYFILAVILLIAGIFFTGCDNTRDDVKDANQDMIDAQNQFEKEWLEFKRDAEVRINDNAQRKSPISKNP